MNARKDEDTKGQREQVNGRVKSRRDDTLLTVCFSLRYWNNPLILTCHPYGILLNADIFSTDISSLRDFLSATTEVEPRPNEDRTIKINAGIACLDRANEVEPRPNEDRTIKINAGIACSDRTNEVEPRPNEECRDGARTVSSSAKKRINDVSDYVIVKGDGARTVSTTANNQNNYINQMKIKAQTMTALIGQFRALAHFQFSIFNFQLDLAEEAENPQPKSRH
jgi:hypothetical protein